MTNTLLFYVADPAVSVRFYTAILERDPVEDSPTFALFILPSGLALGLWKIEGVVPAAERGGGGCDLGFKVEADAVDSWHERWRGAGATIALAPTDLDFGRSFVALDPDGHRLRVYSVADEEAG